MPRPGDRPRPGDKPDHEREAPAKPEQIKQPQKVSPQGGAPGPYQGGAEPVRHEPSYPDDHAPEGGAGDQYQPSTKQEDRPALPDRASAGGGDQLERGTSLTDKSHA